MLEMNTELADVAEGDQQDINIEETDVQTEYLQQLKKDNLVIQHENQLLEAYIARANPSLATPITEDDAAKKKKTGKKGKLESKKEQFHPLTDEEKNDIAGLALESVQNEIEQIRLTGEKTLDELRVLVEEVDMRTEAIKKDTYEFKRDIIIGAENPRTGRTCSEKMIRFLEEKIKQKEALVEKLRLKNATFKVTISKMEQQLAQKEEMGEVLHLVDFDQLKIENQQYMEKIEAKNAELLRLKLTTSKTIQALNNLKVRLNQLVSEGHRLKNEIATKQTDLANFDTDYKQACDEKTFATRGFKRLQMEQEDVDQPQIMDYLNINHEVSELEKQLVDWRRKIELAEMEEKRTTRILRSTSTRMKLTVTNVQHSLSTQSAAVVSS